MIFLFNYTGKKFKQDRNCLQNEKKTYFDQHEYLNERLKNLSNSKNNGYKIQVRKQQQQLYKQQQQYQQQHNNHQQQPTVDIFKQLQERQIEEDKREENSLDMTDESSSDAFQRIISWMIVMLLISSFVISMNLYQNYDHIDQYIT